MEHGNVINIIQNMYSIYDSKADAYEFPFRARNDAMAMRMIADAARNPEHQFHKFGADYTLFYVGQYHDQNGYIDQPDAFKNLGTALSIAASFDMEISNDV